MKFVRNLYPVVMLLFSSATSANHFEGLGVKAWYEDEHVRSAVLRDEPLGFEKGNEFFSNDTVKKVSGDYSFRFKFPNDFGTDLKVGFVPYPAEFWELESSAKLRFWLSLDSSGQDFPEELVLGIGTASGEYFARLLELDDGRDGSWVDVKIPVSEFGGWVDDGSEEISEFFVILDPASVEGVWFDDVRFEIGEGTRTLRVTDKPLEQRICESREFRDSRAIDLYEQIYAGMDKEKPTHEQLYAGLWLGRDLDWLNEEIKKHLLGEREDLGGHQAFAFSWSLFAAPWLTRTYLTFGPGNGARNGRLSDETQELILEKLWSITESKNDIHWARHRNPWWMDGSENHDLNGVVYNYLSSMIFKNLPGYKNRVYPNSGKGGGPGYWFHMHGDQYFYGPYGAAELSDGKEYGPADHKYAWGQVLKDLIRERLRKGIFLEHASPSYMNYTLSYLMDLHAFSSCPELRDLTQVLLDVVWSEWALETINGYRGGAKTRDHTTLDVRQDSMFQIGRYLFGGLVNQNPSRYYWLGSVDYSFPETVWYLAFDRESKGDFALVTRAIGEEPITLPREPGLERTLNLNTEHRMFRYSWITPHYVLGSQHDHPFAVHSHLSPASRSYGLNFSTHPDSRIFPYGVAKESSGDWGLLRRAGIMYRAVQSEHVMLSQQSRGYERREPEWFPRRSTAPIQMGVYFSDHIEKIVEREGWIFVKEGNAFAAVRIVEGIYAAGDGIGDTTSFLEYAATEGYVEELRTDNYQWNEDRTIAVADNALSGLIFDASHVGRHSSFEAFIEDVLSSRLVLYKTVVPGWFILEYQGSGEDAAVLRLNLANNEAPAVNGNVVDYEKRLLIDSPFMRSKFATGVFEYQIGDFVKEVAF